jgi:plastocyanin
LVSLRATCFQILGRTSPACALVALAIAVFAATVPSASAAPGSVSVSFKWLPTVPVVGQAVTFTSTSTVTGYTIQSQRWDLDGNGTFGDRVGASVQGSFPSAGSHSVALQVVTVDKHGAVQNNVHAEVLNVQPSPNRSPVASFAYYPAAPTPGETVNFYSTATDPDSAIASQGWDLDGNGTYGDASGPTASRTFGIPGAYEVGLQVRDTEGALSFVSQTVTVRDASAGALLDGSLRELFPFPVVRLSGTIQPSGIRVRRLTITAPRGARTEVRCMGAHCPFAKRRYTHRTAVAANVWRLRRLDGRFLRAGIRLQVFVMRARTIGRYTRFKIRSGRPPLRVDRCLVSTSRRPVTCPAA